MNKKMKTLISLTLVFTMIASASLIAAKYEVEETQETENRFIGLWQFDPSSYNPFGEEAWFFIRFNSDGTCRIFGTQNGNSFENNGTWYIDDETNDLMIYSSQGSQTVMDYYFTDNFKTLTLHSSHNSPMRFNKIVLEVGPTEPIIIEPDSTDPQPVYIIDPTTTAQQTIPFAQEEPVPNDVVFMETGKTFHPGSVSGICTIATKEAFYRCPFYTLKLYIDGELLSIIDVNISSYMKDNTHQGEIWDTTKYENGLHQLTLTGNRDEALVEMLVIVQN